MKNTYKMFRHLKIEFKILIMDCNFYDFLLKKPLRHKIREKLKKNDPNILEMFEFGAVFSRLLLHEEQ